MEDIDRRLLTLLQTGLSIQSKPFREIAQKMKIDEAEVLLRIVRLKDEKMIQQFGAVFDSARFGYKSTLVGMRFMKESLDQGVRVMADHPGVTLICERMHELNLWVNVTVPLPNQMEAHVQKLHRLSGSINTLILPVSKYFKTGKEIDGQDDKDETFYSDELNAPELAEHSCVDLTPGEKKCIRILQEDFPLTDEPYRKLAGATGMSEGEFLKTIRHLMNRGLLKRIAAVLSHRRFDAASHALIVWRIPEEKQEDAGRKIVCFKEVVSCSSRFMYPDFPFSIYAFVTVSSAEACDDLIGRIGEKIGLWPSAYLLDGAVRKRSKVIYFDARLESWLRQNEFMDPLSVTSATPAELTNMDVLSRSFEIS